MILCPLLCSSLLMVVVDTPSRKQAQRPKLRKVSLPAAFAELVSRKVVLYFTGQDQRQQRIESLGFRNEKITNVKSLQKIIMEMETTETTGRASADCPSSVSMRSDGNELVTRDPLIKSQIRADQSGTSTRKASFRVFKTRDHRSLPLSLKPSHFEARLLFLRQSKVYVLPRFGHKTSTVMSKA